MKTVVFIINLFYLDAQLCVDKSIDNFLFYSLVTEVILSLRYLDSENMKYETIVIFLKFCVISTIQWIFLLWCFGCDHNRSNMVRNVLTASYITMVTTKNKIWSLNIGITLNENNCNENNKNHNIYGTKNEIINIMKIVTTTEKSMYFFQHKPTISYALLSIFIYSTVYLLDWQEKWQKWPIPTIFAAFSGSIIDELLILR